MYFKIDPLFSFSLSISNLSITNKNRSKVLDVSFFLKNFIFFWHNNAHGAPLNRTSAILPYDNPTLNPQVGSFKITLPTAAKENRDLFSDSFMY